MTRLPRYLRLLACSLQIGVLAGLAQQQSTQPAAAPTSVAPAISSEGLPSHAFGYRDFSRQATWDSEFLAIPDPNLARQHLKALTAEPHPAGTPEDYATALYVAARFKAAGLETEIVPYSVRMDKPLSNVIEAFDANNHKIFGSPPSSDSKADPRVVPAFSAGSPSGDVTAPVVYANYGRLSDFQQLDKLGISVRDRIVLVRNGGNYRGVKVYIAQQRGAKAVLIYSDPSDEGARTGRTYPEGPYRPDTDAQRGSVQFLPIYPGDPTTPGIASVPGIPSSERIPGTMLQYDLPSIPVDPLSATDAAPILHALAGQTVPRDWQGGLDFPYHLGDSETAPISVHIRLKMESRLVTIWDVVGKIPGSSDLGEWVIAGNHRDSWVYGAGDPGSGTAAMLETVHGLGVLLHHGWRPHRTVIIASWDAEEEGLIGSTEWVEQHSAELHHAVAYFNMDVAVAGPFFIANTVPSLRLFVGEIAREVPSPVGGTVFQQWRKQYDANPPSLAQGPRGPHFGDLGSGSDYTPFLQHAGVPSTDIGSEGPFGVYHTADDNFDWFIRFADPSFAYTQQQARLFGLELLHMANADILPFDYRDYARDIFNYLIQARDRAAGKGLDLDFSEALTASGDFNAAAHAVYQRQLAPPADVAVLNRGLAAVEPALLLPAGLPRRPWYRHSIYAPGEYTGYEAVVLPGVNEAIDASDVPRAQTQLKALSQALARAAAALTAATR